MDTHAGDGGLHSFHDSVTGVTMFDGNSIAYEYDYLQRQSRKTVAGKLKETYAYAPGSGENTTTTRVSTKRNFWNGSLINQFQHGYDSLGNITSIYDAKTLQRVNYTYDDQNQLLKAVHIDNGTVTRTEVYTYDNVGNILTFNNGITSHTYTYGDENWKDLLTAVDGNAITYDASGNPTSYYNGYTMTWVEGRKLDTVTVNGQTYTYVYNSDGQRVKKIHPDGSYIEYYVMDGITVGESHFTATGNKTLGIRYTLDENTNVIGFTMNGVNYYFAKNLQGDVLAVYNATTNELAAEYTYDSWGNILTATGSLAEINPFRYRGYYYDKETNFYYISSRYYDPEISRFINADSLVFTGQGIISNNMFAYCINNPVLYLDKSGKSASLPPMIENGLNLPASGGIPVVIDGTTYYYAIDIQNGQLYEYWFDADGNLIWGRHHTDHNKPWKHDDPHDHKGGKDKKGNNTLVNGPQPVDEKFHSPDQLTYQREKDLNAGYFVAGVAVGVAFYQIAKWAIATIFAPVTGGGSYAVAGLTP